MVMTDFSMQVSKAQVIAATAASTLAYDLTSVRDPGEGGPLFMRVRVNTAFTSPGGTVRFVAVVNDTPLALAGVTVASSADYQAASLVKDFEVYLDLGPMAPVDLGTLYVPSGSPPVYTGQAATTAGRRYLYAIYLFSAGATLTGAISTDFTLNQGAYAKTHPKSYNAGIGN